MPTSRRKPASRWTYDVYDSNEVVRCQAADRSLRLRHRRTVNNFLTKQIKAGVYLELDHSKLPNMVNLNPELMKQMESIDPGSAHSIPYLLGHQRYWLQRREG